ncbi:MAG: LytTR family transcriptional regulator [Leadbetterella sp.]|jgi:two-component system LytT family response regulator|nr:LytTR family transcriptional regulator [Leadbetterella sp.]MBP8155669.1 LytTR family transcriptional regulator [Leadbetterella sp.]
MNALNILGLCGREQIAAEDIIYLEADINYTTIYTKSKTKHTMSFTLRKVEERLAGSDFLRINRGLSINRNYLQTISQLKKEGFVTMSNGLVLPVSRRRYNAIQERLKNLY